MQLPDVGINRGNSKMAEDPKLVHGDPLRAESKTGEPPVVGTVRARLKVAFDLDLEEYGIPLIKDVVPPARIAVEVVRALFGEETVGTIPPPRNDVRRLSPPTSVPAKDGEDTGES